MLDLAWNPRSQILIVDNEPHIAKMMAFLLRQKGVDANWFEYPEQLLTFSYANPPSLVITDVSMPKMSGIELAVEITSRHPSCKILLFSGHDETLGLLEKAKTEGHEFALMSKPISTPEMLRQIRLQTVVEQPICWASPLEPM